MFIVRTKKQGLSPGWGGYCYVVDQYTNKLMRFNTNSEALSYLLKHCKDEKVLNGLEIIDEDTDEVSRIAKNEDGLILH